LQKIGLGKKPAEAIRQHRGGAGTLGEKNWATWEGFLPNKGTTDFIDKVNCHTFVKKGNF